MLVVKQCSIGVKTLTKLLLLITFLITDLCQISASLTSRSPSINLVRDGIIDLSHEEAPSQFPESSHDENSTQRVEGIPIVVLQTFLQNPNITVIKKISETIENIGKDKLPTEVTVILSTNDTHVDTHIVNNSTKSSNDSITLSEEKKKLILKEQLSKRSTIIFLVAVTAVSIFFYVLLVSLRNILERKYGDKELLMQSEVKNEDYLQDRIV